MSSIIGCTRTTSARPSSAIRARRPRRSRARSRPDPRCHPSSSSLTVARKMSPPFRYQCQPKWSRTVASARSPAPRVAEPIVGLQHRELLGVDHRGQEMDPAAGSEPAPHVLGDVRRRAEDRRDPATEARELGHVAEYGGEGLAEGGVHVPDDRGAVEAACGQHGRGVPEGEVGVEDGRAGLAAELALQPLRPRRAPLDGRRSGAHPGLGEVRDPGRLPRPFGQHRADPPSPRLRLSQRREDHRDEGARPRVRVVREVDQPRRPLTPAPPGRGEHGLEPPNAVLPDVGGGEPPRRPREPPAGPRPRAAGAPPPRAPRRPPAARSSPPPSARRAASALPARRPRSGGRAPPSHRA